MLRVWLGTAILEQNNTLWIQMDASHGRVQVLPAGQRSIVKEERPAGMEEASLGHEVGPV